jgi:hypothetical protein
MELNTLRLIENIRYIRVVLLHVLSCPATQQDKSTKGQDWARQKRLSCVHLWLGLFEIVLFIVLI